ncbi:hypothetical protein D3C74_472930 [compost metagenome]
MIALSRLSSLRIRLMIIRMITKENGKAPMMVPVWTVSTTAVPPRVSSTVATVAMLSTSTTRKTGPDLFGAETNSLSA